MVRALPKHRILDERAVVGKADKRHRSDAVPVHQPVVTGQYDGNIDHGHDQQQRRQHIQGNDPFIRHDLIHKVSSSFSIYHALLPFLQGSFMLLGEILRRDRFAEQRLNHVQVRLRRVRFHLHVGEQRQVAGIVQFVQQVDVHLRKIGRRGVHFRGRNNARRANRFRAPFADEILHEFFRFVFDLGVFGDEQAYARTADPYC